MDESSLKIILENNISMIFEPENYRSYLKQGMSIQGYDFMNRFLIFFQNRRATDIKDSVIWAEYGRRLVDGANPVWILIPRYETKYFDKDTGKSFEENIKKEGLTIDEINKAVELGIIERRKELIKFKSSAVYDINDTVVFDEYLEKHSEVKNKQLIELSVLSNMCKKLCNMNIEVIRAGETSYKIDTNTLYINKESSVSNESAIIKILVSNMVERSLADSNDKALKISGITYADKHISNDTTSDFIVKSVLYTVYNYLGISCEYTFDNINKIYEDIREAGDIELIMNIIEETKDKFIGSISNNGNINSVSKILAVKKAEQLLDILEANNIRVKVNKGLGGRV